MLLGEWDRARSFYYNIRVSYHIVGFLRFDTSLIFKKKLKIGIHFICNGDSLIESPVKREENEDYMST
jgi:hypothetical protein